MFKVGNKDAETILVSLLRIFNNVCLIFSADDLFLKWHHYILALIIISFILQVFFRLDLLCCWAICILLVIWFHIDKASEKKINIYAFRKITFFFTFKVGICLTAYVSARALTTELHIRDKGKIPQQLYSLLEHATFYYIVCLEVSNSYGVIPNRLKIKKFCVYWKCKYELSYFLKPEINKTWKISQHVRKLYAKFFFAV